MARTVMQLRQAASRRLRDLWIGTLTSSASAAATTLIDTRERVETDHYFRNGYLRLLDHDLCEAEDHRISDSFQPSTSLTLIGEGLQADHIAGSPYEIHKLWSPSEYDGFLADALMSVGSEAVISDVDDSSSVHILANTRKVSGIEDEYFLPAGLRYLERVQVQDINGAFLVDIPLDQIRILPGSPQKRIKFSEWACANLFTVNRRVRLLGQSIPSVDGLVDLTDIAIDPDYLISYVEMCALAPIAAGTNARAQAAARRMQNLTVLVEQKRGQAASENRAAQGAIVIPQ